MKQWGYGIVMFMFMLSLHACKTQEQLQPEKKNVNKEEKLRFREVISNAVKYDTFTSKVNLKLNAGGNSFTTKGTIRIIKDELFQLSIQPILGIEMFRIQVTPDSIIIIDKPGRRYLSEAIADFINDSPIDVHLNTLQALFMNQVFIPNHYADIVAADYKSFDFKKTEQSGLQLIPKHDKTYSFTFQINSDNLLQQSIVSTKGGKQSFIWEYSGFEPMGEAHFPMRAAARIVGLSTPASFSCDYLKPEWNKPFKTDKSVSSQYRRVRADEIINSLLK